MYLNKARIEDVLKLRFEPVYSLLHETGALTATREAGRYMVATTVGALRDFESLRVCSDMFYQALILVF